jgi:hypothetical protein
VDKDKKKLKEKKGREEKIIKDKWRENDKKKTNNILQIKRKRKINKGKT